MARILLQADDERTVLLDEKAVRPEHLQDEHSSAQLLERLEWAIKDADRKAGASRGRRRRAGVLPNESAVGHTFD